ncbi:MAG: hypothetical protein LBH26_03030 [Treponema sp.]|jgi:putative Ca2+/H+ antiporter (TMEM165/GDT1 family)|nr:hypothetical protein [Treponema sp.]
MKILNFHRPLRVCLLLYEFIRLFTLLWVVGSAAPQEDLSPWLVYGSANALFLIMALFLLLDISWYRPYIPLYTAGKMLAAFSAVGWIFFSRMGLTLAIVEDRPGILVLAGGVLGIASGDLLSAAAGLALGQKLKERKPPELEAETAVDGEV